MRRVYFGLACVAAALALAGCADKKPPVNRVGVNVVDKGVFTGSWYYQRQVIDVDYEAAGVGTFPGDTASDFSNPQSFSTSLPRVRWVIDENTLYAYRDYEMLEGGDGEPREAGDHLGHPVAAYDIEKHFDIQRSYVDTTGEERNVIVENDTDRRWYERQYMRVDWSKNLLPGYYGQTKDLYEVLGLYNREPADLYVQSQSEFPNSWRPQFHRMACSGPQDESESCTEGDRMYARDYEQGELYSFSFVTQELMSPGMVPSPFTGRLTEFCDSVYSDRPQCTTVAVFVRNSFLKVSDERQYRATNWTDARHERHGYFRHNRRTYDRSTAADDPRYGATDFLNYNVNRHNIWYNWHDENGEPVPYQDREVRPIVWHTTTELPSHLVQPSFKLVSEWNRVMMNTVRRLRGESAPDYPTRTCQKNDPDGYCFCRFLDSNNEPVSPQSDQYASMDPSQAINSTCPGRYDPFQTPEEAEAQGAENPFQCWVDVPEGAEPNMSDPGVASTLEREDFHGWFDAEMKGEECVNVLRINTCNQRSIAENGGTKAGMNCQERGDMRFNFLSYVDQPGTAFLGIATMRGDPITGEVLTGDANIGGPALDSYRTTALQHYDLMNGNTTDFEILTGEDVRSYLSNLDQSQLPAPPRVDFNVASRRGYQSIGDPMRQAIGNKMDRYMGRARQLKGPEGRANTYLERKQALAGSQTERRLLDNAETLMMAGVNNLPKGKGAGDLSEQALDDVSPFRTNIHEQLQQSQDVRTKISKANVLMPNAFTDVSVLEFVRRHKHWPRARVEFEVNRLLYYETQLHEMGHCLGLRHQFGASADTENYYDQYYRIREALPLPDPREYASTDGEPGMNAEEQAAYREAYEETKRDRELAGIDRWMNSSIMEYTAQWYHRTVNRAGRYDDAAIAFGYGDLVEVYDNETTPTGESKDRTPMEEINPVNTGRRWMKYYKGGEVCNLEQGDSSCPYSESGARSSELLQTNLDAGVTQSCVENPDSDGPGPDPNGICTGFQEDIESVANQASGTPRWVPVDYRFCTDDRVGTIGWCHRFDEGDSYREIVRNTAEQYERQYIFTHFRRYRKDWTVGQVRGRLQGRYFGTLQNIFQNLLFKYAEEPSFRNTEGRFGFYDQFMATTDILNFYARVLAQPEIGSYEWNPGWERYELASVDPDAPRAQLRIPLGQGRYFNSRYQEGLTAIDPTSQDPRAARIERVGTFYDKLTTMRLLTARGWQPNYTRDVAFYTNFYDLFPVEIQQMFQGIIQDEPEAFMPRLRCQGDATFPQCNDAELVYMNFYRGDCSQDSTCRPHPVQETYADMPIVSGGQSILLQSVGAGLALTQLPTYFDTSFQNQLFICVEGQGDCHQPSEDAVAGEDFVRYTSTRFGKTFLAWQVEPTQNVPNQRSIGFSMIEEAKNTSFLLETLRTYRGDFGGAQNSLDNLSQDQEDRLGDMDYVIPGTGSGDGRTVQSEIRRLDSRLRTLESFFFQTIQLERDAGIVGPVVQ